MQQEPETATMPGTATTAMPPADPAPLADAMDQQASGRKGAVSPSKQASFQLTQL